MARCQAHAPRRHGSELPYGVATQQRLRRCALHQAAAALWPRATASTAARVLLRIARCVGGEGGDGREVGEERWSGTQRQCYARLHIRSTNCRKKKCGHNNDDHLITELSSLSEYSAFLDLMCCFQHSFPAEAKEAAEFQFRCSLHLDLSLAVGVPHGCARLIPYFPIFILEMKRFTRANKGWFTYRGEKEKEDQHDVGQGMCVIADRP
ncbi:hypothetical protein BRADI_1g27090v3 [Brachypodium distachyon]|uniref:Large ribosomal subunit protein eL40 domain-containing protein n=1 Tax=Brachypodium distachyon TaxID=15368 RepID=I1GU96_BRADI|nr:hypothetical protein BRADI_1g27090v3 [Brachypodium distachyon]